MDGAVQLCGDHMHSHNAHQLLEPGEENEKLLQEAGPASALLQQQQHRQLTRIDGHIDEDEDVERFGEEAIRPKDDAQHSGVFP